jgi:2'-5' RNA ligase
MSPPKDKYSLCVIPAGRTRELLQALINELARKYDAPSFVPHVTLVSNILAGPEEIPKLKEQAKALAQGIGEITISLSGYGFTDEEFRCLFLLAHSPRLDAVYSAAASVFPQVNEEHFRELPHLSVLYGNYPPETKQEIIANHELEPINFIARSFDLYQTNNAVPNWRLER